MATFRGILVSLLVASVQSGCINSASERTVELHGARLPVPANWRIESDADSTLTISPARGSDALRLTVIVSIAPKPVDSASARRAILTVAPKETMPIVTACGATASAVGDDETTEDGRRVFIRRWFVAHASLPDTLRIAVFTYAMDAAQAGKPDGIERRAVVDSVVRRIEFPSPTVGLPCAA